MDNNSVDSTIIRVFRLFAGGVFLVHIILLIVSTTIKSVTDAEQKAMILFSVTYGLIYIYLLIPSLPDKLKGYYLPPPLAAASIIPIGITNYKFRLMIQAGLPLNPLSDTMTITILLIFPLIITAWQYRFPIVFLFFVVIGFMDPLMIILSNENFTYEIYNIVNVSLIRILALGSVGFIITELRNRQRIERHELEEANKKLEEYAISSEKFAASRERNRIAREMHDTLAHTLSGLAIQLEAIETVAGREDQKLSSMLDKAVFTVRNGLAETRRALKALRASPLEDLGLTAAIKKLADDSQNRDTFSIRMKLPEKNPAWSPTLEENVYRITQEALENIVRHAHATEVTISLEGDIDSLRLVIRDNGRGFQASNFHEAGRFGLWGMKERAAATDGRLEIKSQNGQGTEIIFTWSQLP
jgi:signal transduction histidine kinase